MGITDQGNAWWKPLAGVSHNGIQCPFDWAIVFPCRALIGMGLLPDTLNCGLSMRRECRERFSRHRFQRKPLVSDPSMHRGTCVTHVPWRMLGLLTRGGGENVPGIPGACTTRNFTYLARGPLMTWISNVSTVTLWMWIWETSSRAEPGRATLLFKQP